MLKRNPDFKYKSVTPKISGYTTVYNALNLGYPVEECVRSMLGFCDEVVVVDGVSTDGSWELLQKLSVEDDRVKLYQNEFDWTEPGVDGIQKAFARCLCENEYLWQMDIDEIVSEQDYEKIKLLAKKFPKNADILHLPIIECWGSEKYFTARRANWKFRLSRNKPEITHGICNFARRTDEKTGKVYAAEGQCDGCCYTGVMDYKPIPNVGFYNEQLETMRLYEPKQYEQVSNQIFEQLPGVFHYSWYNLENKVKQLRPGGNWQKLWSLLYRSDKPTDRFAGVETEEQVKETARKLFELGGEESDRTKYKCVLQRKHPKIMEKWIEKQKNK